jgi:hypothetical protein
MIFVLKELAPALRSLLEAIRTGDRRKRIEALLELEVAAEMAALEVARKKLKSARV